MSKRKLAVAWPGFNSNGKAKASGKTMKCPYCAQYHEIYKAKGMDFLFCCFAPPGNVYFPFATDGIAVKKMRDVL